MPRVWIPRSSHSETLANFIAATIGCLHTLPAAALLATLLLGSATTPTRLDHQS